MADSDNAYAVYALFKLAWSQYDRAPADLDEAQQREAAARVAHLLNIESAILYADENQGVVVPPSQLRAALSEIRERFDSDEAYLNALAQAQLSPELLEQGLIRELHVEAVLERVTAGQVVVTDADAELFYYLHPERFAVTEKREARHILVTVNDAYEENSEQEALRRIELIRQRLQKKPERFEEQAQKHSECPTAMHGGLIGRVERGKLYPELEEVLFGLRSGEISAVVRSPLGFHLIACGEIEEPRQVPLEEILPKLRQSLEQRQRSQFQRQWIAEQLNRLNALSNSPARVVNA